MFKTLEELINVIRQRKGSSVEESYTKKLLDAAPERLLWGSDWPHPDHFETMPNDGELLDLMLDWTPDPVIRKMILPDNPKKLFGFS